MYVKKILGFFIGVIFVPLMASSNTDVICSSNGWCYSDQFPKIIKAQNVCKINEKIYVSGSQGRIAYFNGTEWSLMQSNTKESLEGLWCGSDHNIYATGTHVLEHYDGKDWKTIESDIVKKGYWHRVWADNEKIILAGYDKVAYFDGKEWNMTKTGFEWGNDIESLWGKDMEHLYAVGGKSHDADGFILQFNGTEWKKVYENKEYHFLDIFGFSENDIYAIGTDDMHFGSKGILIHYDGKEWKPYVLKDMNVSNIPELGVMWGDNEGLVISGSKGKIYTLKENSLKLLNFPYKILSERDAVNAIWRDASGILYIAVGNDDYNRDNILLFRFYKKQWELVNPVIHDLYMPKEGIVFAVGQYGTIWKYSASSWEKMQSGSYEDLQDIWGSAEDNIYAVGRHGTLLHFDGKEWKQDTSLKELASDKSFYGIWGSSQNDIYVIAKKTVYHYDGNIWKNLNVDTQGANLKSISGIGKDDLYVTSGDIILHYDGKNWESLPMPSKKYFSFKKIFATKDGGLFGISTSDNTLYSYNQKKWKGTTYSLKNASDTIYFRELWGNSKDDLFVVGGAIWGDGFVIHFDGTNWQEIDTFPESTPLCLVGIDGKLSFIAGANGWFATKNTKISEEKERLGKEGKYEKTELHKMVAENNIKQVEKILDKGINVNVTDKLGRTPLHYAAIRGYVEIAELLLDRGANVNAVDSSKQWTPLFYATFIGDQKMIELLMSRGADMTIKDTFNRTVDDYKKD
jgi:photosystem II stability/assembly factor-like uncharacterized protein